MFLKKQKNKTKLKITTTLETNITVHALVSVVILIISIKFVLGKQGKMVTFQIVAFKHINAEDQIQSISQYFVPSVFCELVLT